MKYQGSGSEASATHRRLARAPIHNEGGVVSLLVVYGLSLFSVLALAMITDPDLDRKFRSVADYDLHVVLFGGRPDSERIISRLNVPTLQRATAQEDFGTEVTIPLPIDADVSGEFGPGSTYAVQLGPDVRVCCDTGDNACDSRPHSELPVGSANRTLKLPIPNQETTVRLTLSTFPVPEDLALDPTLRTEDRFLIKAAKEPGADPTAPLQDPALMCKMEKSGKAIASGILALQRTAAIGQGPFTGKIQLRYGSAKGDASQPK
jgi:hypothetical protein